MLTQERKDVLIGIIKNNKQLLSLEPSEAVAEGKKLGYEFTLEELKEFAEMMKASDAFEVLDLEALDDVAGGGNVNVVLCSW